MHHTEYIVPCRGLLHWLRDMQDKLVLDVRGMKNCIAAPYRNSLEKATWRHQHRLIGK
jgi:hypothetical protein